jgi:DNA-binding CsgD family transcriptional regulator
MIDSDDELTPVEAWESLTKHWHPQPRRSARIPGPVEQAVGYRAARMLEQRDIRGLTYREIGQEHGISGTRVQQILKRARHQLKEETL